MPVFSLVQSTPPSMLLQLGFPSGFGGEKNGLGFWWKTKMCLALVWLLIQFSLIVIDGKSCPSTHTFNALF